MHGLPQICTSVRREQEFDARRNGLAEHKLGKIRIGELVVDVPLPVLRIGAPVKYTQPTTHAKSGTSRKDQDVKKLPTVRSPVTAASSSSMIPI